MTQARATPNPLLRARVTVRTAEPSDHASIRAVVRAAYGQYAQVLPIPVFDGYLADLVDLDRHASQGTLLVAEAGARIQGSAAFYPNTSVQGLGWPEGWSGGRGLAVRPGARGLGVARALIAESEQMARATGSPVFAFHTAAFMSAAVELYEHLGYQRAPEFDLDLAAHYGLAGLAHIPVIAYWRDLNAADRHNASGTA
jgi:GNAT superfamily N-acetyltransferase